VELVADLEVTEELQHLAVQVAHKETVLVEQEAAEAEAEHKELMHPQLVVQAELEELDKLLSIQNK